MSSFQREGRGAAWSRAAGPSLADSSVAGRRGGTGRPAHLEDKAEFEAAEFTGTASLPIPGNLTPCLSERLSKQLLARHSIGIWRTKSGVAPCSEIHLRARLLLSLKPLWLDQQCKRPGKLVFGHIRKATFTKHPLKSRHEMKW